MVNFCGLLCIMNALGDLPGFNNGCSTGAVRTFRQVKSWDSMCKVIAGLGV